MTIPALVVYNNYVPVRTILLFLILLAPVARAGEVAIAQPPKWVEGLDVSDVAVARESVRWGLYDLLNDHQVRVGDDTVTHYYRTVRKVLTTAGVSNASEVTLDFDPSFERLTLHDVVLLRNGRRLAAFDPGEVRVIEKEESSGDGIYDGQRTALLFLRDVRPGDILDYSWSIDGANPILGGRYADDYDLSTAVPAGLKRHRLLWPAGRPLHWRGGEPAIGTRDGLQEFVWERRDIAALAVEDSIPSWYEPWESVQVSELASWNEVAIWAEAMFRLDQRSLAEVAALAATIRSAASGDEARITSAIRFVQDDIRYLGIEMGRNSHEPRQPWQTLEQRWGDCKDKTLLLVALLRELGVDATPALVSTTLRHQLGSRLPSPFVFDHVIARIRHRGETHWIDSTIAGQGGMLGEIDTPDDGLALLVDRRTVALTPIVVPHSASTLVEQIYTTTSWREPVGLSVVTTYRGGDADRMRAGLADLSIEDFAHERINALAIDQPAIQAESLPAIDDDRTRNVITIRERYRVPALWNRGEWTWYPRLLESSLQRPETMIRSMPLAVPWPLDVTQIVRFDFPERVSVETGSLVTETPAVRYESSVDRNGKTVTVRQAMRSTAESVSGAEVSDHLTRLNAIWSAIGYTIAPDGAQPAEPLRRAGITAWTLGLAIVAAFVSLAWLAASRRRPQTPRLTREGDAPASAVPVYHPDDIDQHLAVIRCACGAVAYTAAEVHRARYSDRELTIVTRHCRGCGQEQSVYFTAA